jgi:Protein of unknown function (DUF2975)
MTPEHASVFSRRSWWLGLASVFICWSIAALFVAHSVYKIVTGDAAQWDQAAWLSMAVVLPIGCYVAALHSIGSVFFGLSRGEQFQTSVSRGLRRAGLMLLLGGVMSSVGVINLIRLFNFVGLTDRTLRPYQGLLHFDMAYVCIAIVGCALMLLGQLMIEANEIANREQRLKSELSEFV